MVDKKAVQILFKTYWTSKGWIDDANRITAPADLAYAKEKGVMFDPLTITKEEVMKRLADLCTDLELKKKVTDAFLCSLTNKRLDWRSGLGSYANAKRLLSLSALTDADCYSGVDIDLNILNFERIKWSGVRHFNGLYNWLDLSLLNKEDIPAPTEEDITLFKNILVTISASGDADTPVKLLNALKTVIAGSTDERHCLIEILSCAGILQPARFDRKEPHTHDWHFALHWRGEDSYNPQAVDHYFKSYL